MQISVMPATAGGSVVESFLAGAATSVASRPWRKGDLTLKLRHDMIPTISALTERSASVRRGGDQMLVPFLVAGAEYSQPALFIELPKDLGLTLDSLSRSGAAAWPKLHAGPNSSVPETFPAGAIRLGATQSLSDPELMVPVSGPELSRPSHRRQPITWLIQAEAWQGSCLERALFTIGAQIGGSEDAVCFLGAVDPRILATARERFDGRVIVSSKVAEAWQRLRTPLTGFLGAGVLLHDDRTAMHFSSLLENDGVATASCVLVTAEKRGKGWHASIEDGGSFAAIDCAPLEPPENIRVVEQLWRTHYPVAEPSLRLWVMRSPRAEALISETRSLAADGGYDICSSLVTASYVPEGVARELSVALIAPQSDKATKCEALFG
jgi:hypothetical protein